MAFIFEKWERWIDKDNKEKILRCSKLKLQQLESKRWALNSELVSSCGPAVTWAAHIPSASFGIWD